MLHNAYIYIYSNSKGGNEFFKHAKCSSQVLNSFEKRKKKKCDFSKRIIISFKCCFGELH